MLDHIFALFIPWIFQDVHCSMEPLDHVLIGSDFTLRFIVYNKSDSIRTLKGTLVIYSTKYTGHRTDTIKMNTVHLTLHPSTGKTYCLQE